MPPTTAQPSTPIATTALTHKNAPLIAALYKAYIDKSVPGDKTLSIDKCIPGDKALSIDRPSPGDKALSIDIASILPGKKPATLTCFHPAAAFSKIACLNDVPIGCFLAVLDGKDTPDGKWKVKDPTTLTVYPIVNLQHLEIEDFEGTMLRSLLEDICILNTSSMDRPPVPVPECLTSQAKSKSCTTRREACLYHTRENLKNNKCLPVKRVVLKGIQPPPWLDTNKFEVIEDNGDTVLAWKRPV